MLRFGSFVGLGVVLSAAWASPARAEGQEELRQLVRDELKAYNEKKKADDAKDMVFKAKWKEGLSFETPDKQFTFRIGGRIHLDTVFSDADDALDGPPPAGVGDELDNATYFRRARLYLQGDVTSYVDWRIQMEFADPTFPLLRDAYITVKNLKECLGCWMPSIRVGHQWDCLGLESQTSTNHIAFIEKSLTNSLHPERGLGISFFDSFWKDRAVAQLGAFSTDQDDDASGFALWDEDDTDGGWAVTGRFALVPWARDTCRFVHLGVGGSYRDANEVRYRARPGLGRGARLVDTGALTTDLDEQILLHGEAAVVWRSLHASAEYSVLSLASPTRDDPAFTAWYVQVGWFLTGEAKAYDFKKGLWANNKPCCSFLGNGCCCSGAWEVAARLDTLDLNDGTIAGGEMTNLALGVNWYLNPHTRLMFDVVFSNTQDRNSVGVVIDDADVTSFLMRWDVHF